jgi:cell division protein FtsQ
METKIAERRAEVRRERMGRRRRRALAVLLVGLIGAGMLAIARSSLVALAEVEVVGADRVEIESIVEAAALPIGSSTLRLRLGPAQERVEAIPEIRSAHARRIDPLSVRIEVIERQPAIAVVSRRSRVLIDIDGIVLGEGRVDSLPTIVVSVGLPEPGQPITDAPSAGAAFQVYRGLPGPLRSEVVRYEVSGDDIVLVLDGGAEVRFGRPSRIAEKARVLGALIEDLEPGEGWRIDVRAPNAPVVAPPA